MYRASERFLNRVDVNDDELNVMIQVETLLYILIVGQHRVTSSASAHTHTVTRYSLNNTHSNCT